MAKAPPSFWAPVGLYFLLCYSRQFFKFLYL